MPTEHTVRKAWLRLRKKLTGKRDEALLQPNGLERASLQRFDELTHPHVELLDKAFEVSLQSWSRKNEPGSWLKVLVLPPCDGTGLVETWARAAGHQVLQAPPRDELTAVRTAVVPELAGSGLLVIPRLEHWFLRQRNGLQSIRALLAQLTMLERHCVIACNSWAWQFLVKAAGADLMLPRPLTLAAYDAERLGKWFEQLAADDEKRPLTFRLASTGEDVLACNDKDELQSGHLQQLAARSLGIPWVAGRLWRASLNATIASEDLPERAVRATADDARTVWVAEVGDPGLPRGHEDRSLLALQALLIHDGLTARQLEAVLPATGEPDVIPALLAGGFLDREEQTFRVRALAYPAARRALQSAGFPLGQM